MPLKDDNFAKVGKPEAYTKVLDELMDEQDKGKPSEEYTFDLEDEQKDDNDE
ncbi:MAG: hypothetical protein PHH04_01155 [Thomasclavelia sp.]|nr:hypothetical protein [Thomasclavelia sp.]